MAPIHPELLAQRQKIVAREIQLAKALAGNEPKNRNKVLRKLHRWLACRSASSFHFSEHDFMRLWKGLFYCVWMSDKPLVQEELCENIAKLFTCFGDDNVSTSVLFYKCFLKTMANDWFGIDQHRIDKFLMLVRRITRGMLNCIKKAKWNEEATDCVLDCLTGEGGLFASTALTEYRMALGLQMHLVDCWMEEIAKVSEGKISKEVVSKLVKPFAMYMCYGSETRLILSIVKNIFNHLVRQTDLGIEYNDKLMAWKSAGFPGGDIEAMEKVEVSDDENGSVAEEEEPKNTALDPRAGYVDTVLPQLPVDEDGIASIFRELMPRPDSTISNRKRMKNIIKNFETLGSGEYPFKVRNIVLPDDPAFRLPNYDDAALELMNYEVNTEEKNEAPDLKGLSKSQKKRLLAKQRRKNIILSDDEDDNETTPPSPKKSKTDQSNNISKNDNKKNKGNNAKDKLNTKTSDESKVSKDSKKKAPKDSKESNQSPKNKAKNVTIEVKKDTSVTTNGTQFETPVKSKAKLKTSTPVPFKVEDVKKKENIETPIKSVINKFNTKLNKNKVTPMKMNGHSKENGETEILIPMKKSQKNRLNKSDTLIVKSKLKGKMNRTLEPRSKKVDIVMAKNTVHSVQDYFKTVRQSPDIPYDSTKKPSKTSLKPNAMPSPVNPFYRKKINLDMKSFDRSMK